MPWAFIPFIFFLNITVESDLGLTWRVETLVIPVAAWVGYRYGSDGVKAVFLATVLMMVSRYHSLDGPVDIGYGYNGGLLFAGLAFAWLFSSPENPKQLKMVLKTHKGWYGVLILLPVSYLSLPISSVAGVQISVNGDLSLICAVFILGLIQPKETHSLTVIILFFGFLIGFGVWQLSQMDIPAVAEFERFSYWLVAPIDLLTTLIALYSGHWVQNYQTRGEHPKIRFVPGTLSLIFILFTVGYVRSTTSLSSEFNLTLFGSFYLTIMCCFLAGLFYGNRGIFIIAVFLLGLTLMGEILESNRIFLELELLGSKTTLWPPSFANTARDFIHLILWTCVGVQLRKFPSLNRPTGSAIAAQAAV